MDRCPSGTGRRPLPKPRRLDLAEFSATSLEGAMQNGKKVYPDTCAIGHLKSADVLDARARIRAPRGRSAPFQNVMFRSATIVCFRAEPRRVNGARLSGSYLGPHPSGCNKAVSRSAVCSLSLCSFSLLPLRRSDDLPDAKHATQKPALTVGEVPAKG